MQAGHGMHLISPTRAALALLLLGGTLAWLQGWRGPQPGDTATSRDGALHTSSDAPIQLQHYNALLDQACASDRSCQQPARLLAGRAPRYPSQAMAEGRGGHAQLQFVVMPDGHAARVQVLSSSAPEFALAATQAIASWQLQPPVHANGPQPDIRIRLEFAAPVR